MPHANNQPQLFQNQFVNPGSVAPGAVTATGLSRLGSRGSREREDINVQIARSLMLDPRITDTHRLRLKGIIAANSPEDRAAQEQEVAIQRRRFERHLDRNPDMTAAEVADARQQFEGHNPGQAAPFALTLAAETAQDQPILTKANAAQHFQDQGFGHADSHLPYVVFGEDGQVDGKQLLVYRKQLMDERQANSTQMSAVKNRMRTIQERLKVLREDGPLFDDGRRLPALEVGGALNPFGTTQNEVDAQSSAFFEHDNLARELADLESRQSGFVTAGDQPVPAPTQTPPPQRVPEATIRAPLATPEFSATQPYTLQPNDDVAAIARAAQEWARENGPTIIIDPATNISYEIK